MNILDKITTLISNQKIENTSTVVIDNPISMTEREDKIYGEGKLALQRLYEKWTCKETWFLYNEGIPLLLGIDPDKNNSYDNAVIELEELWIHAQDCVHKNLLPVINIEKQKEKWEVRPIDLYCWATVSRISIPVEFSTLMAFVVQTVKLSGIDTNNSTHNDEMHDFTLQRHKEIVLGAAISLLINASDMCKNSKGQIMSSLISKQITENANQWFGNEEPLLAESAMTDLINGYLELGKPVIK